MIGRAVPGMIIAAAAGSIPIGIAVVGFLWQQTVSLAKMNETMQMVCKQLEEKKFLDDKQDSRMTVLETNQARILQRLNMQP